MKLQKNYFENLTNARYREYLKLLPDLKHENTRLITTLILTFIAMSFLGIFAINPTLSTIVTLKKQLTDSELVLESLQTKNRNLSSLLSQYNSLNADIPIVFDAVPKNPTIPPLAGQIAALGKETRVSIKSLRVSEVQLAGGKQDSKGASFVFFLETQGAYENLINFASSMTTIDRVVSLESLSINKDPETNNLILSIRGRGYFKN